MIRFTLIVSLFCIYGCSGGDLNDTPDTAAVSGTVTLDGKPVEGAVIMFSPTKLANPEKGKGGRPSVATTDSSGGYKLEYGSGTSGAAPGTYSVTISTATTKTGEDGNDVEVPESIPAKYNEYSELSEEVKEGSNTIDFKLTSEEE